MCSRIPWYLQSTLWEPLTSTNACIAPNCRTVLKSFVVTVTDIWLPSQEFLPYLNIAFFYRCKGKGKAVPLQAWSGPEGFMKFRFPDFMKTAQDGGKVVSLTHRPPLPPGNTPGTHFC
jgi:hypothetical protein